VPTLDDLLQPFGVRMADLAGSSVAGEIPLTDRVVNGLIAAQLAGRNVPVAGLHVEAQEGDAFTAHVAPKARFVPPIRVTARVDRQPDLPDDAVLWLRWSLPGLGALAAFAAPVIGFLKVLPPGVRVEGERIGIDIRELLVARGAGEVAGYLRTLRVHTRPGAFLIRFDVKVPDQPA
jgi:hypothetical protein